MKKFIITCAILLLPIYSIASDFTLLTSEPGRKAKAELSSEALFIEVVKEALGRANLTTKIKKKPWIKAQQLVKKAEPSERLLIAPLTRTKEREDHYDWIVPLASYKLLFVTVDKSIDILDIKSLKKEAICVLRESPAEYKLKELGFPDILSRVQVQKCFKGLKKGSQKVVLAHGERVSRALYQQIGGDPKQLILGQPFTEYTVYLAATKAALPESTQQKLRNAMDAMKIDQTYEKIFAKYR